MRDYYAEFLARNSPEPSAGEGAKVSEVSVPVPHDPFAPFAPTDSHHLDENAHLKTNIPDDLRDEIEERIAIMIFDGGITEREAWEWTLAKYWNEITRSDSKSDSNLTANRQ